MSFIGSQNSNMKNPFIIIIFLFLISTRLLVSPGEGHAALFPDGILVRPENALDVFYIQGNVKRLIASAEAFLIQGFHWGDIRTVPKASLALYQAGETVTQSSNVVIPGEEEFLPDLIPFPLQDVRLSQRNGRTILKFTSTFWNAGQGPLELNPDQKTNNVTGDVLRDVYQHIPKNDGSHRDRLVGIFLWHDPHKHYHFDDFADYIFEPVSHGVQAPLTQEKTSRCIWDTKLVALDLPRAPQNKVFTSCENRERQGISVGWGDIYDYTLADQYLDIEDAPPGIYRLSFKVDPRSLFTETRKDNNSSVAYLRLDVSRRIVEVIAAAGPFSTSLNFFSNEVLIQGETDPRVYVTHTGKKRWIRDENVFNSYGYSWTDIRVFPQRIVDLTPSNNLIRADGVGVYALNDFGYKRHLRSPDILASYSFGWNDITDISEVEFAQYPEARLVRIAGNPDVYYIADGTLRRIPSLEVFHANGFSWEEVHIINEQDFASYILGTELKGTLSVHH